MVIELRVRPSRLTVGVPVALVEAARVGVFGVHVDLQQLAAALTALVLRGLQ